MISSAGSIGLRVNDHLTSAVFVFPPVYPGVLPQPGGIDSVMTDDGISRIAFTDQDVDYSSVKFVENNAGVYDTTSDLA